MKQLIGQTLIGVVFGVAGLPCGLLAMRLLEILPPNARPDALEVAVGIIGLLVPAALYLKLQTRKTGAKGVVCFALGVLLGVAVPAALLYGLLLIWPMPPG